MELRRDFLRCTDETVAGLYRSGLATLSLCFSVFYFEKITDSTASICR